MQPLVSRFVPAALTLACVAGLSTESAAVVIEFEDTTAYPTTTSLSGKTDPSGDTWQGSGNWFEVAADTGNRFVTMPSAPGGGSNRITPSASNLGGSDDAAGQYSFSVDLRSEEADTAQAGFGTVLVVRIAQDSGTAVRINVASNGRVQYLNGSSAANVILGGNALELGSGNTTTDFVTLSGVIDFDTNTYTLAANGESQNGGNAIAFNGTGHSTFGLINLEGPGGQSADAYRAIDVDNIAAAVPEPGSMALLTLGSLMFLRRK
jgi:hypothetical protein